GGHRTRDTAARNHEHRVYQVSDVEGCLADELAEHRIAAHSPGVLDREPHRSGTNLDLKNSQSMPASALRPCTLAPPHRRSTQARGRHPPSPDRYMRCGLLGSPAPLPLVAREILAPCSD